MSIDGISQHLGHLQHEHPDHEHPEHEHPEHERLGHDETGELDVDGPTAPDEAHELLTTLLSTPLHQLTGCQGWTGHELVAHLAAGADEEADLIEAQVAGRPERATRSFDEREAPYRALADGPLRERLFEASLRLTTALQRLGSGTVRFTGWVMTAGDIALHSRSECAIHRWDLVGRDDAGWAMLRQPALTRHAASVLMSMPTLAESVAARLGPRSGLADARVVLRSGALDDVVVELRAGVPSVTLAAQADAAADLECDAAQRLLLLWGRREPSSPIHLHATGSGRALLERLVHGR